MTAPPAQAAEAAPTAADAGGEGAAEAVAAAPAPTKQAAANPSTDSVESYVLVYEQGWAAVGVGDTVLTRHADLQSARAAASKLWCCWVLYRCDSAWHELAAGGVGLAWPAIRRYAAEQQQAASGVTPAPQRPSLGLRLLSCGPPLSSAHKPARVVDDTPMAAKVLTPPPTPNVCESSDSAAPTSPSPPPAATGAPVAVGLD